MGQRNKVTFLTADHLEAQADARVREAAQLPPDFRAYLVGSDGHFYKSIALDAPDEAAAIAAAKQLADGHDVELWQRDRKIARFDQKKK